MDRELFELGLCKRKETLVDKYVTDNLAKADSLNLPFQEAMTEWCWEYETIDARTRSLMNLSMIAALGKMHEWELHLRGAITNGVTVDKIRSSIHATSIYCGVLHV
jgi:4-carboxymuconolactone decarboxylase